ncbi:MAG: UDP-N-acetylmuramate--L-alanine ligase [Clostridiales bacterium]|nr:UDP-N-acetylmuramate--L-alanine ligase [Clostridiales bacterium]
MLDFTKLHRVHLLGIGGISMSSIAMLLTKFGIKVSGQDKVFSEKLLSLSDHGITVYVGTELSALDCVDLVVYSSAIKKDSPELIYCQKNNIPTMERYLFLGIVSRQFENTIAIAGTHGKTTTTSMLTRVIMDASIPFCAHIGGEAVGIGNFFYSGNKYFVTEACEYRQSLLALKPDIAIVLNAESDHPDTYKSLTELYDTFDNFVSSSKIAIINGDSNYYKNRQFHNKNVITFGLEKNNHYVISNLKERADACYSYDLAHFGIPICHVELNIESIHTVFNSAAAIICSTLLKVCLPGAVNSIFNFQGVQRRFQKLGYCQGAQVISDYAHHPTEVYASIATAKKKLAERGQLYAVFQPHTFSRTFSLFSEFLQCFTHCDALIICKEYSARETPNMGISAKQLFDNIEHKKKHYYDNILDIAGYLIERIKPNDIILILGAGDIDNLGKILLID